MNQDISLRIILEASPQGIDFGIQKGSGTHYDTIQIQRSDGKDLMFEFALTVKIEKDGTLNFLGELAQGTRQERFVYIDIGRSAGQLDSIWSRRLKIPLKGITPEVIGILSQDATRILEAKVPGTAKDGGPNCATVKPFLGWHLVGR